MDFGSRHLRINVESGLLPPNSVDSMLDNYCKKDKDLTYLFSVLDENSEYD